MNKRKKRRPQNFMKITSILTVAAVLLGSLWIPGTAYAQTARAISITLKGTQGPEILVATASDRKLSPRNNMKLYSGYRVSTGVKSFAYMALDEKKAVKLGELSRVEIKKEGRKNEIKVICGKLFFNVKEKLSGKEAMTISTSNISMGIRGTSGSVSLEPVLDEQGAVTEYSQTVQIYDGSVALTVSGATEKKAVLVNAGEEATLTPGTDGRASITKKTMFPSDIPSFAGEEMLSDKSLFTRVKEGTGFTAQEVKSGMESSRLEEEKITERLISSKENNSGEAPDYFDEVLSPNGEAGNTDGSESNSPGGGNSGGSTTPSDPEPTFTPEPTPVPPPVPTPTPDPAPSSSSITLNLDNYSDIDLLTYIEKALEDYEDISLSSSGERTVTIDRKISIKNSQALTIGSKLTFLIVKDGDLANAGTITNKGTIKVEENGRLSNSLHLYNDGKIENDSRIENSGFFENKGSFIMDDDSSYMLNSSKITNQGGTMKFLKGELCNDGGELRLNNGVIFDRHFQVVSKNGGSIL